MHAECGSFATAVHVIIKSTNPQVKKEIMPDIRSCRRRNGRIADDLMAYEPNEQAAACWSADRPPPGIILLSAAPTATDGASIVDPVHMGNMAE